MLVSDKGFNCTADEKRTHEGCGGTIVFISTGFQYYGTLVRVFLLASTVAV